MLLWRLRRGSGCQWHSAKWREQLSEDWVDAASDDELPVGKVFRVALDRDQILLVRSEDDQIFAVGNQCTHQGAGLDKGVVKIAGSVQDRDLPGSREHVQPRDREGHEAAGLEAGARLRREGRGRPRLRSAARARPRASRSSGLPSAARTRAGRCGSAPGAPAPVPRCPRYGSSSSSIRSSVPRASPASAHADDVREVVVADRHRVGIAERQAHHLRGRPRTDPRHRFEPAPSLVERHVGERLERRRPRTHGSDHLRAASLHPPRVEPVVRNLGHRRGIRGKREAALARRRFAQRERHPPPRASGLHPHDLLLQDRRDQGPHDVERSRESDGAVLLPHSGHHVVVRLERGEVVLRADQRRRVLERPRGAGTPGRSRARRRRPAPAAAWRDRPASAPRATPFRRRSASSGRRSLAGAGTASRPGRRAPRSGWRGSRSPTRALIRWARRRLGVGDPGTRGSARRRRPTPGAARSRGSRSPGTASRRPTPRGCISPPPRSRWK